MIVENMAKSQHESLILVILNLQKTMTTTEFTTFS